jgi:selenide,water dikinase
MLQHDPHACTDITGYGLVGHGNEMAEGSDVTILFHSAAVPLLDGAREAVEAGYLTGGGKATRRFMSDRVFIAPSVGETMTSILFDAQTSGGLLIAVAPEHAAPLLAKLQKNHPAAAIVGECATKRDVSIVVD